MAESGWRGMEPLMNADGVWPGVAAHDQRGSASICGLTTRALAVVTGTARTGGKAEASLIPSPSPCRAGAKMMRAIATCKAATNYA